MGTYEIEIVIGSKFKNGIRVWIQDSEPLSVATIAHIHNTVEIICVKKGSFTVYLDDKKYEIFPGDVILFRSNAIHHIITGEEKEHSYYILQIKPEALGDFASSETFGVYSLSFGINCFSSKCLWTKEDIRLHSPEMQMGIDILRREEGSGGAYSLIALKYAVGLFLLGMVRTGAVEEEKLKDADKQVTNSIYQSILYVNQHYAEDVTARAVCKMFGMSYSYFSRTFRAMTGRSFKEYLNMVRINSAEKLLSTTDLSIKEIAAECGYNDVSYFIKVFREQKSVSPGGYKTVPGMREWVNKE